MVCRDCRQIIFQPVVAPNAEPNMNTVTDAIMSIESLKLLRVPLDYLLIELAKRTNTEVADYVDVLMDAYDEDKNGEPGPPHTWNGSVEWWVTE